MSRSRLLLLPLLTLTLFFMACGWHAGHLTNSEDDVWLVVADSFPCGDQAPAFSGQEDMGHPFISGQSCVLGVEDTERRENLPWNSKALPSALLTKIQAHPPDVALKNWEEDTSSKSKKRWEISLGRVKFRGKYQATCCMKWDTSQGVDINGNYQGITLLLARSPLPFGGSRWQVVSGTFEMMTTT